MNNQDMAALCKSLADWQAVYLGRLEQWGRNGPSPALKASIAEASKECSDMADQIMNSAPPARNRY